MGRAIGLERCKGLFCSKAVSGCEEVRRVEFDDLLSAPGVGTLLEYAPIFGGALWVWLTVSLWRGGFNDLIEQMTWPGRSGAQRFHAGVMMPVRAISLSLAAGLGAGVTTLGIVVNIAVILNVVSVATSAFVGKG